MQKPWLPSILLFLYLALLFYLTLLSPSYQRPQAGTLVEMAPFDSIMRDVRAGGHGLLVNIFGNIAAFLPFGFLLPWLRPALSASRVALWSAALSTGVEVAQFFVGHRVTDAGDVLLNATGGLCGYLVFRLAQGAMRRFVPGFSGAEGGQFSRQRGRTAKPS